MTTRKPKPHSETAFVPMSTKGVPYLALGYVQETASAARLAFGGQRWDQYRREGWRIVKVKIEVIS